VAIAVLWTVLVVHNLGFVPRNAGFDAFGHMEYIQHIQAKGTLPAGNEGWEMHQPPLYYSVAAALLNAMHLTPDTSKGLAVLRLFSLAVGLVHILFIFGNMRLLFPSQISLQVVGLLFGSFLPMQLYLVHYVTNETFAACLISGTIYLVLKLLQEQKQWSADASLARRSLGEGGSAHSWFLYIAVGVCLGLALLSKITALVVAPFVLIAMWWPLVRYLTECARPGRSNDLKPAADRSASHALEQSELAAPETGALRLGQRRSAFSMRVLQPLLGTLACIAVCAWYFRDVWKEFGNPFFAPTRWAYAVGWWQDPGYRTAAYFTHFGRSLIDPLLSGVASFADGIYSTLWGDGYCGGLAEQIYRPPWNYNLMVASYLLALIPKALLMAGIARSIRRMIREPELSWVLLIGFSFAMVLGIVHLNLMVPIYAQAKAFFGHSALTALCAFMAMGWRCVENRGRTVRMVAAVLLGIWAVTSYASFWVSADSAAAQASIARDLMNEGKPAKALPHLIAAIEQDPRNIAARSFLVSLLRDSGQITNALEVAQQVIQIQPDQALSHMDLAGVLDRQDHKPEAVNEIRRATELAPDSPEARLQLASHLMELRRYGEAITASREALRVLPTDPEVHNILAYSLLNEARTSGASSASANEDCLNLNPLSQTNAPLSTADILTAAAIAHFRLVVKLAPRSADPFNTLAWILSTYPRAELRNASEALELARAACAITKDTNAEMLATLAAAHAENGQFEQAVQAADRAAKLPITNAGLRERIEKMMKLFGANHPYRQESKK